jgi:CRISPR-associated protein Csc3
MAEMHIALRDLARFAAAKHIRGRSYKRNSILDPFSRMLEGLERYPDKEDRDYLCAMLKEEVSEHIRRASPFGLSAERCQAIYTYVDRFFIDLLDNEHHGNPTALLDRGRLLKPAYLIFFREVLPPKQQQALDNDEEGDSDEEPQ